MAIMSHRYPLDLSGESPDNRMVDDWYKIGSQRSRVFVPRGGPFYAHNAVVTDMLSGRVLEPVKDYRFLHHYNEAAQRSGKAVYAAVLITTPECSGEVLFTAQHVGGEYSHCAYAVIQSADAVAQDDRPIYWKDLLGVPQKFKPAPHYHHAEEFHSWGGSVYASLDVARAVLEGSERTMERQAARVDYKLRTIDAFMQGVVDRFSLSLSRLRDPSYIANNSN